MLAILHSLGMFIVDLFKSRCRLEAENLFLRHQLSIALRRTPLRVRLRGSDRALLVWMTRLWPSLLGAAQVVQPETILRWHRAGDEQGKPGMGRVPDPWRTPDAGVRGCPVDSVQIHDVGRGATFAKLEDIPAKPRAGDRRH